MLAAQKVTDEPLMVVNEIQAKDIINAYNRGDQRVRAKTGYKAEDGIPRLNILEVQRLIRFMPKVVIAVVPGWAARSKLSKFPDPPP